MLEEEESNSIVNSTPKPSTSGNIRKRKSNEEQDYKEIMKYACDNLKTINSRANSSSKETDDDIFAKHVGATLKSFNDERAKALCKLKIQELLYTFQFGSPTNQPVSATSDSSLSTSSMLSLLNENNAMF